MFTLLSEHTAQGNAVQGGWCWRRKQGSNRGLPECPRGESRGTAGGVMAEGKEGWRCRTLHLTDAEDKPEEDPGTNARSPDWSWDITESWFLSGKGSNGLLEM